MEARQPKLSETRSHQLRVSQWDPQKELKVEKATVEPGLVIISIVCHWQVQSCWPWSWTPYKLTFIHCQMLQLGWYTYEWHLVTRMGYHSFILSECMGLNPFICLWVLIGVKFASWQLWQYSAVLQPAGCSWILAPCSPYYVKYGNLK